MEFRVLGPLEVSEGSGPIPLGGPKQRAVLAHLLLRANQVVSVEILIDALWGDEPPDAAKNTLQSYVSHLRRALGAERIEGRSPGYVLHADPHEVDALRFEALVREGQRRAATDPHGATGILEEALSLWKGTPVADLASEDSLQGEIARFEELRRSAIEDLIGARLEAGRHAEVVGELERLTQAHPLRERLWHQLMVALYRSGRQGDALNAFHRARETLADELGIDPSPDLRRLQEQILRQDPQLELRGEPLRGYRLLERIGEGAFGVVHRAIAPELGREVAIKRIRPELADDAGFVRAFEAEAQAVARLEHPNVVPLYDYWREPGGAYLVMRYLRGGSLADALRDGPLPVDPALRVTAQVASAVAAAHRQGVVHGDVKPSNVLLDEEGNAYLADFGIAGSARGAARSPAEDIAAVGALLAYATDQRASHGPPELTAILARATGASDAEPFPDADALVRALGEALARETRAESVVRVEARNPYKGLRPFSEADAADFFGREALVERLVERLAEDDPPARFLAVVGPSGSGKSSSVRAGLLPALRTGAIQGSERWFVAEMAPGAHPLEELEAALLRVAVEPPASLLELLTRDHLGLLRASKRLLPAEGAELLLLVDQFEELFTLVQDETTRRHFLDSLHAAVSDPRGRVRVVATLRADFVDRPLAYPGVAELLRTRTEMIVPLTVAELERAVEGPARRVGARVEPGLLAEVVADVREQAGALPLLQYALTELFERRRDGVLSADAYREIGGISGALARRADELYGALNEPGREATRQLFLRLVTLGEGVEDTRRRVARAELAALEVDATALDGVIETFGRHRLLTFDRDPVTRGPTVEVAHEALLRASSRLRGWIDDAREDLRTHRRLAVAAAEWDGGGRDPSFLLRGTRLGQIESWLSTTSLALSHVERSYLDSSVARREEERAETRAREQRERRLERRSVLRLRALVAVFAAAALVAAGLTVVATQQSRRAGREARRATARELAAASVANLDVDPELSLHLAIRAVETTREVDGAALPEAEEALHTAVGATRIVLTVPALFAVDFAPDGARLATTGEDRIARIQDVATGEELVRFEGHEAQLVSLELNADGSRLATTSLDGEVRVWDATSGEHLTTLRHSDQALSPMWQPDGQFLAVSDHSGLVLWDVERGERLVRLPGGPGHAFSPDGSRLVAPSDFGATIWEVPDGSAVHLPFPGGGIDANWSPDGKRVAVVGGGGEARVYDATTGEEELVLRGLEGDVGTVEFSPDGSRIATGGNDGLVRIWDADRGRELLVLPGLSGTVQLVGWSPDGTLLAAGGGGGRAIVWDVTPEGGRHLMTLPAHEGDAIAVAFDPSARWLATAGADARARVWDAKQGALVHELPPHDGPVLGLAFSPDGTTLTTGDIAGNVRSWDPVGGTEHRDWTRKIAGVTGLTYGSDGRLVAVSGLDGSAALIDAESGRIARTFCCHEAALFKLALSPEGELLATVGDDHVGRIWEVETGELLHVLEGHSDTVFDVAFDPRGGRLASVSLDGTVRLWSTDGGALDVLEGVSGGLHDIAFDPSGSRFATSTADGTVILWDAERNERILTLRGHRGAAFGLAFSPDGNHLASAGEDGTVRVYELDLDRLLDLARGRTTRSMNDQECRRYLHVDRCPAS